MNHLPLVSIVTPVYNQAETLAETIDSVLAQDYPNIEYLVLDDGSTDDTPEVLRRYDGRVRWERQKNLGQAETLNKGWRMCRGEYVGYIAADDRLVPNTVSTLVAAIEARPDIALVYPDYAVIDARGNILHERLNTAEFDFRGIVEDLTCHPGPAALFRRTLFEQAGGWDPKLRFISDFEFFLRAAQHGKFMRVPQVLAEYRVHDNSGSVRPIAYERSMEIVDTMKKYWGNDRSDAARRSLARAHHKAACSHAQSGRLGAAVGQFVEACKLRPRTLAQRSLWRPLLTAMRAGKVNRA